MAFSDFDIKMMAAAYKLAVKGEGFTEPNPMVGAVVTHRGRVISTGYHSYFGGLHAERKALERVEQKGTTLYVTLEPCNHFGKTPPCTDIITEKQVERVVVSAQDPNPLIKGRSIELLRKRGIKVETGLLEHMHKKINAPYVKFMERGAPWITVKAGVSIDCRLTDYRRVSQWVTSEKFRNMARSMRGAFSAIMTGSSTAECDNPTLLPGEEWHDKRVFYRVVLDTENKLNQGMKLFTTSTESRPLVIFSSEKSDRTKKVEHHYFVPENSEGNLILEKVFEKLSELRIASVMVEGGGKLINSLFSKGLWDEAVLFFASKLVGGRSSVELFTENRGLESALRLDVENLICFDDGYIFKGVNNVHRNSCSNR